MIDTQIAIFKGRHIRKTIYKNEWWFSVVDVVWALTDSVKPRVYWNAMKTRVKNSDGIELSTLCRQLRLKSSDGKKYETDCANTESLFRIIQSIPSPKAEPFKRWLARVGGDIAGGARKKLEKRLSRSIVSPQNYLPKKRKTALL